MAKVKDLTTGSPIKLMLLYALPVLAGNICQQIYNFADTIIVGQKLGENALAAVGTTGSMYFLVNGFVIGITSGFAVHVSQRFGAKDYDGMRNSVFNAVFLWGLITVIITALAMIFSKPMLRLINTPDDIIDDAQRYILTIYAGILAPMLYNAASCILRAVGDSKTPLYFLMVSAVLNIGMDLFFIVVFKMGVFGAALATVIAQFVSGVACIVYMIVKFPILRITKADMHINGSIIKTHLTIGLPMAFQFSITAIGTIVLQGAINKFGATRIAAVFAMVVIFFFGRDICGLFIKNRNPVTLDSSMVYLNTVIVFFIPLFLIFVFRNALQAMGKTFMPLMAGVFELVARTIASFTLPDVIGFKGVCLAGPIAWVSAMTPLLVTYIIYMVKFKKKGYFKARED